MQRETSACRMQNATGKASELPCYGTFTVVPLSPLGAREQQFKNLLVACLGPRLVAPSCRRPNHCRYSIVLFLFDTNCSIVD